MELIKNKVIIAYKTSHPIAFNDLMNSFGMAIVIDHKDVKNIVVSSLVEMSKNLDKYNHEWNTFSDIAHQMDTNIRIKAKAKHLRVFKDVDFKEILNNTHKVINK